MGLTKLDAYPYEILPGIIRIYIDGTNDPDMVDILSEINRTDGQIYVEGSYYSYLDECSVFSDGREAYLELKVAENKSRRMV